MASKSQFTGAKIDEALAKILNIEITENGCIRLPSTESSPINLDTQTSPGFYELDYYTSSRSIPFTEQPITLTVIQFTDPDTGNTKYSQIVSFIGKSYSRDVDRTDPAAPVYTEWEINAGERQMIISTSDPAVNTVALYTPYINIANAAAPVLKILIEDVSGATPVRKWIDMVPSSLLSKAVYDPKNHATDIFKYVDDAIAAADIGTITEDFTTHINDATIHATQAERDSWNAKVSQENLANTLQTLMDYIETQVTTAASTLQGDATDIATKLTDLNTKLDAHAADTNVHPSAEKMAEWDSKANGDHTHLLDNRVEINARKVVSGILDPARIPDKAYMKIVSVEDDICRKWLKQSDVQNGDTVYQKNKQITTLIHPIACVYLRGIMFGNDLFVAYSDDNLITTSLDGANWTPASLPVIMTSRDEPKTYNFRDGIYANNKYVVVGNEILYSSDGFEWTESDFHQYDYFTNIAYGNGLFVVMDSKGKLCSSTDGITWSVVDSYENPVTGVITYGAGEFIVVTRENTVRFSSDLVTWRESATNLTDSAGLVRYLNNQYIVGVYENIWISPDGITWTKQYIGWNERMRDMIFANGVYVAVGYDMRLCTSADLITWDTPSIAGIKSWPLISLEGVAYGNGLCVAVGLKHTTVTSTDMVTWSYSGKNIDADLPWLFDVDGNDNRLIAVGSGGVILTSPDGITWTKIVTNVQTGTLRCIVYRNGLYMSAGDGGNIISSPDGINWTKQTSGVTGYLWSIAYNNDKFVVVGSGGVILTSPDGITWTKIANDDVTDLYGIKYILDQFIAVGNKCLILTSPDGITWTKRSGPNTYTNNLSSIAYDNKKGNYLAVGYHCFAKSSDSINWTIVDDGSWYYSLNKVIYSQMTSKFIAVSNNYTVYEFTDTFDMMRRTSSDNSVQLNTTFESIIEYNNQYIIVGRSTHILSISFIPSNSFYYVIKDMYLNKDKGWLMYSSTQVMELVWEKITGRPTTLSGYGITDAYNKSEVDTSIKTSLTDPLAALQTKLDDITTKVNTLATYTNSADIKLLTSQLTSLADDFDQVKAQHAQILASVKSIDTYMANLKALI